MSYFQGLFGFGMDLAEYLLIFHPNNMDCDEYVQVKLDKMKKG